MCEQEPGENRSSVTRDEVAEKVRGLLPGTQVEETEDGLTLRWVDGLRVRDAAERIGARLAEREAYTPRVRCTLEETKITLERTLTPRAAGLLLLDNYHRRGCRVIGCTRRVEGSEKEAYQGETPETASTYPNLAELAEELGATLEELERSAEYLLAAADRAGKIEARRLLVDPHLRQALHQVGHPEGLLAVTRAIDHGTR